VFTPGLNEGVNIPPRGQSLPLGANYVFENWPLGVVFSTWVQNFPRKTCEKWISVLSTKLQSKQCTYLANENWQIGKLANLPRSTVQILTDSSQGDRFGRNFDVWKKKVFFPHPTCT
jgi:hypothetical protein